MEHGLAEHTGVFNLTLSNAVSLAIEWLRHVKS